MDNKKIILISGVLLIFISIISAYAYDFNSENEKREILLDETNESDLFGCCSIACQLDGNDSIFAFRRDARYEADIHIEKINWHGKEAIKQYKTDGGYFCQVIVTNDGWTIGFGGSDDGEVNQQIENITAKMVENNKIDNATLEKLQALKAPYKKGHVLIKSPEGDYGVAMATTHFTGKLKTGDYISIPNNPGYIRNGDIQMNSTDKVKILHKLEMSDLFGVDRRDITTFHFHHFENNTHIGNQTDIAVSNYKKIGTVDFPGEKKDNPFGFVIYIIILILFIVLLVLIIRTVNKIRFNRKQRKRMKQYRSLYKDDRYRYR